MHTLRRPNRLGAVILSLLAVVAGPQVVQAQDLASFGYSIIGLAPLTGDPITEMVELEGTLGSTDLRTTTGMVIQVYELQGSRGQPFSIDVMSTDFDAYLMLVGPGYGEPETDDDSGGACNARLTVFLPEDGPYRVVVASLAGSTGTYQLRVDAREHPPVQGDCGAFDSDPEMAASLDALSESGTLSVGAALEQDLLIDGPTLSNDSPAQAFSFTADAGADVWIDAISVDFDPYLYVVGPGISGYLSDDDSGGECNARIRLSPEDGATYRVVVRALTPETGGLFTLRASTMEGPDEPGSCGF